MAGLFARLFGQSEIDPEVLMALRYKLPSALSVSIHLDPTGMYIAKIEYDKSGHPYVTQGETGEELIYMVNDLIFTMCDIPVRYRPFIGSFSPPVEVREALKVQVPAKLLDKRFELQRI